MSEKPHMFATSQIGYGTTRVSTLFWVKPIILQFRRTRNGWVGGSNAARTDLFLGDLLVPGKFYAAFRKEIGSNSLRQSAGLIVPHYSLVLGWLIFHRGFQADFIFSRIV